MSPVNSEYTFESKLSGSTAMDNLGSAADGKPPKRFQKSTSDASIALRRPPHDGSSTSTSELRSNFGSRRTQSVRDQKASQPPPALHPSPSKRVSHYNAQRSVRVPPTGPHSRQTSTNQPPSYQFGSSNEGAAQETPRNSRTVDFLPTVSFDDFHASLTTDEPSLSLFPKPGIGGSSALSLASTTFDQEYKHETRVPLKSAGPADTGSRIGRSGPLLRRQNSQSKTLPLPREDNTMIQTGNMAGMDAPRKRQLPPPNANINVLRSPRKSVGPGVMTQDLTPGLDSELRASNSLVVDFHNPSSSQTGRNFPTPRNPGGSFGAASAARGSKTKSLHIPAVFAQDPFGSPFHTPDSTMYSLPGSHSPGRPNVQRTTTPSSNKRQSILPNSAHATGLAARTISPTDARRLKRMSMMPNPPPIPFTLPTPLPDTPPFADSSAPSPSVVPRKSLTPTSSRTTPEQNRKSYSSCISNSSTTSYNSCLSSTGPVRISQTFSASRLPMLKTRHDPLPTGGDEVVPPVPAIPKAYESPKADIDQPFFSARKSSLPNDSISLNSISTADGIPTPSTDGEVPVLPRKPSLKKPRSGNTALETENKYSNLNMNRRTLQPLRLPPMNLLPLSTPTTDKIAALYDGSGSKYSGSITPPPKAGSKGIPSTPMTASRASFFAKSQRDEDPIPMPVRLRSSSSHHALRSEDSLLNGTESSSSTITDHRGVGGRSAISPFISSSLPKPSGRFRHLTQGNSATTNDLTSDSRPSRLTGPRLQKGQIYFKGDDPSVEQSSPIDTDTESFGRSLRRKLSLTRKRSSSKSQSRAGSEDEGPPKPPKHDNMPPPKLPASATWNGPFLPSVSPVQKGIRTSARRKVSNPITPTIDRNRSNTWTDDGSPQAASSSEYAAALAASKTPVRPTFEGGVQPPNSMGLKNFLREAKNTESQLDRDDQQAEDEMKRLALKRKDTENAAKELDALIRRATAKERVSPNQALRIAKLNIFERGEIVDYSNVYFCGTDTAKKHNGDLQAEAANFGYDDERGDYNIVTGDHLAYRYEIIDILGKGSFGQVVRCIDHKTGGLVAIKIIRNKKRFHQQALVEVDILQKLRDWDPQKKHSMVQFTQSFYFRGHLCISTELLGMNLYEFIKCHEFRGFSLKLIRRFAKQLLSSLVLLNSHKIIHCDLKPENVLLAHPARSEIKVIDFGSSCMENEKVYTYIQSRFYRSPEVILGMTYGMPIDMWSLGCILAELLTGYPIFPGENEQEQLACIMEVFGPPEKHLIEKSTRKKLFFDSLGKPRLTVSSKGKRRRPSSKTLQQALKCEDEPFLDFIARCLRWDPDRRLKPDEAIQHEFITGTKAVAKSFSATASRTLPQQATTKAQQQAATIPATNSPAKRLTSTHTPSAPGGIRPLPEPPATAIKVSASHAHTVNAIRNRDLSSSNISSPSKTAASHMKRQSTVNGPLTTSSSGIAGGVKRTVNGNAIGSGPAAVVGGGGGGGLPRVQTQPGQIGMRSVSGKPDLAVAGAVASLQKTRS
ncbi:MAG: hypothetical protein LQ338_007412 [Usnochroma carphineum]|nr:MAG: hypothetical protein LQ338_007412 [Usnochroma carphineum]